MICEVLLEDSPGRKVCLICFSIALVVGLASIGVVTVQKQTLAVQEWTDLHDKGASSISGKSMPATTPFMSVHASQPHHTEHSLDRTIETVSTSNFLHTNRHHVSSSSPSPRNIEPVPTTFANEPVHTKIASPGNRDEFCASRKEPIWSPWHSADVEKNMQPTMDPNVFFPFAGLDVDPQRHGEKMLSDVAQQAPLGQNILEGFFRCSVAVQARGEYDHDLLGMLNHAFSDSSQREQILRAGHYAPYANHAFGSCNPDAFGKNLEAYEPNGPAKFDVDGPNIANVFRGERGSVKIHLSPNWPSDTQRTIAVRLVGPSIVAAEVVRKEEGISEAHFVIQEPGPYLLEVLVSEFNQKLWHQLVYRGRLNVSAEPEAVPAPDQRCQSGDEPGRWVRLPAKGARNDAPCCLLPYCEASSGNHKSWLNDELGYNRNYVWVPWTCHYKLYTPSELKACFGSCSYDQIGFTGDSLGRELFTSMVQILAGGVSIDGRKWKHTTSNELTFDNVRLVWNYPPSDSKVHVYTPPIVTFLESHLRSPQDVVAMVKEEMERLRNETTKSGTLLIYQAPAAVQYHGAKLLSKGYQPNINRAQMEEIYPQVLSFAKQLGIPVLDTFIRSNARWFSTHDGLHYSKSTGNDYWKYGWSYQWQGGVAHMNAMVFLNMLCTRPCAA